MNDRMFSCRVTAIEAPHAAAPLQGYEKLGFTREGSNTVFREWAPVAQAVSLIGDFNGWKDSWLTRDQWGVWSITLPDGTLLHSLPMGPGGQRSPAGKRPAGYLEPHWWLNSILLHMTLCVRVAPTRVPMLGYARLPCCRLWRNGAAHSAPPCPLPGFYPIPLHAIARSDQDPLTQPPRPCPSTPVVLYWVDFGQMTP